MSVDNRTDEQLLTDYYDDHEGAYDALYHRQYERLVRLAMYHFQRTWKVRCTGMIEKARDAAQNTLLAIIETKRREEIRWNSKRGMVAPWMDRILRNEAVNQLRKTRSWISLSDWNPMEDATDDETLSRLEAKRRKKNRKKRESPLNQTLDVSSPLRRILEVDSPLATMLDASLRRRLKESIDRLPDPHRTIFRMRHNDSVAPKMIAQRVGLNLGRVYRYLKEAEHLLRRQLE